MDADRKMRGRWNGATRRLLIGFLADGCTQAEALRRVGMSKASLRYARGRDERFDAAVLKAYNIGAMEREPRGVPAEPDSFFEGAARR